MRQCLAAIFFGLLAIGLGNTPTLSQPRIDAVEVGFNGRYLPDAITPIIVSLSSTTTPVTIELEIFQEVRDFESSIAVERLRLPVSLAPGTRKSISLDFPIRGVTAPLRVRLLSQYGEVAQMEVDLRERWSDVPLSLGVGLRQFLGLEIIAPTELPKRWTSYESVQRIYWGRLDPAHLNPEQRTAIYGWLLKGGELIVLGGQNWYEQVGSENSLPSLRTAQGWWASLMPIRNARVVSRDVEGRQVSWLEGDLRNGGKVSEDSGGQPLWWERSVGLGKVRLSALADFPYGTKLPEDIADLPLIFEGEPLIEDLIAKLTVPFPSREGLSTVLVLFVSGFGLCGFWALRHPKGAWVLLIWAVFISLVLFWYLRAPEFSDSRYSLEVNVVLGWMEEPFMLERSSYSLFVRQAQDQALDVSSDSVKILKSRSLARISRTIETEITSTGGRLLHFHSDPYSIHSFQTERLLDPEIEFSLDYSVSPPQVRVYNQTVETLRNVIMYTSGGFYVLGTIAAGAEIVRSLSELRTISGNAWANSLLEEQRTLWRRWERFLADPTLVGWIEGSDGSPWAMADDEQRVLLRLVLISGRAQ